jgi:hypothetical protein
MLERYDPAFFSTVTQVRLDLCMLLSYRNLDNFFPLEPSA